MNTGGTIGGGTSGGPRGGGGGAVVVVLVLGPGVGVTAALERSRSSPNGFGNRLGGALLDSAGGGVVSRVSMCVILRARCRKYREDLIRLL